LYQVRASRQGYGLMIANLVSLLPTQAAPETTALTAAEIWANGEFIQRAVNAHDDLLAACERMELSMNGMAEWDLANGLDYADAKAVWGALEQMCTVLTKVDAE
jgi:hypothetical protein